MAEITGGIDGYSFKFEGKLQKIYIESNNLCFGPCPESDTEIEQHLTITSDAKVELTRQSFSNEIIEDTEFSIDQDKAMALFKTFEVRFSRDVDIIFATDVGSWDMTLTNEEGQEFSFNGSLIEDGKGAVSDLSDIVREALNRDDLFVFDGNPDRVEDLTVRYHRISKIKPKVVQKDATWEYVTWEYSEELKIERGNETLTHIKQIAERCKQTNVYEVEGGVSNLLDEIYPEIFDHMPDVPDDIIDDPNEVRNYEIILNSKHGEERKIKGYFDKYGLPEEWADFIDKVYDFMAFYGVGELFNEAYYNKPRRRKSDYIFCDVAFEEGSKTYCYIADDDIYEVDDMVLVPAGKDNHEAVVRIVSKNYYTAENAPFPVDKAKHIIKKMDDKEFDEYLETGELPKETGVMSSISIEKIGITHLKADAVVNAANSGLWEGGGVCGYIFRDAGSKEMTEACYKIGHCDEGSAVITPGFKLPAKYVIHAVGPRWSGGNNNEPKLLYSAYKQSLLLAKENNLHSIGFPLISAGIFGYPVDKAWRKALQACQDFIENNPDYAIDITFAVLDDEIKRIGEDTMVELHIKE